VIVSIDPGDLRLPPSRQSGADPFKLAEQIRRFGDDVAGMPRVLVTRGANGLLMINDGVTRAVRIATLLPGATIEVEVIEDLPTVRMDSLITVRETI
jgi:hypothetical protein